MKTIWKYAIPGVALMPAGAEVLTAQMQNGQPVVWALVNTDELHAVPRKFVVVITGSPVPDEKLKYIGTLQDGPFVAHVFEELT